MGGKNIESDLEPEPKIEPDAEATLPSLSLFSVCFSEGPDYFSHLLPPYPFTSVYSKPPEHVPSNDIDDGDDADIRASVIQDVKHL